MNIKNDYAHELAKELSQLTGESQTQAVIVSLEERLRRVRREKEREKKVEALLALGKRTAPLLNLPKDADHTAWMYDENGLPI